MGRAFFALMLCLAGLSALPCSASAADAPKPVVLELFTSNSCEQCPPANEFMRRLQASPPPGIEPILLSEHVDYWNPYGWVDRYSSAQFTERQKIYGWDNFQGKIYTPQLIIDGRRSTVGTWENDVHAAIRDLATQANRPVSIGFEPTQEQMLAVQIDFARAPEDDLSQIWVALVQDNVVAKVDAGENGGRTLHEDGLVRTLIQARASGSDATQATHYRASLTLPSGVDRADLAVVAFAQRADNHAIVGATRRPLR
ncbi:DUF1223 domain-containing protein [Salinisphaera aquimarina]|uniref:DUF1223 domain-containing protein n=1 Tax=Salinisphaera aquimarina TaxID=2094031 RepID=A0ABV7EM47_9GAMM